MLHKPVLRQMCLVCVSACVCVSSALSGGGSDPLKHMTLLVSPKLMNEADWLPTLLGTLRDHSIDYKVCVSVCVCVCVCACLFFLCVYVCVSVLLSHHRQYDLEVAHTRLQYDKATSLVCACVCVPQIMDASQPLCQELAFIRFVRRVPRQAAALVSGSQSLQGNEYTGGGDAGEEVRVE